MQYRHALDQIVRDDAGHAAEGARELPDQLRLRMIACDVGDPLDPAADRLDIDSTIRPAPGLFGVDLAVTTRGCVEIIRLQALEVGEPKNLISVSGPVLASHRGVRHDHPIDVG